MLPSPLKSNTIQQVTDGNISTKKKGLISISLPCWTRFLANALPIFFSHKYNNKNSSKIHSQRHRKRRGKKGNKKKELLKTNCLPYFKIILTFTAIITVITHYYYKNCVVIKKYFFLLSFSSSFLKYFFACSLSHSTSPEEKLWV